MSEVYMNQLHKGELPWIIEYDESKCIQCGKCTAACSFGAIKPALEHRKESGSITEKNKLKQTGNDFLPAPVLRLFTQTESCNY